MLAEIRFSMLLDAKLLFRSNRSLSWTHTETQILQVGGEVSAGFADALTHTIVPHLDGLSQHLGSPDGSFLWGGCLMVSGQVETLLKGTGFVDVRTLASPPGAIVALIAARRAPDQ